MNVKRTMKRTMMRNIKKMMMKMRMLITMKRKRKMSMSIMRRTRKKIRMGEIMTIVISFMIMNTRTIARRTMMAVGPRWWGGAPPTSSTGLAYSERRVNSCTPTMMNSVRMRMTMS